MFQFLNREEENVKFAWKLNGHSDSNQMSHTTHCVCGRR